MAGKTSTPTSRTGRARSTVTRRAAGFTLIEILIVITVLGILAAAVVPQFSGSYQEARLRAAGRELLAAMNIAYSQAITAGQTVSLLIEPAEGRYRLEASGRSGLAAWSAAAGEGDISRVAKLPGASGRIDPRIAVHVREAGEAPEKGRMRRETSPRQPTPAGTAAEAIRFRPDGTADAREILLEDQEGFLLALRLHPTTARVELQKLGRDARR